MKRAKSKGKPVGAPDLAKVRELRQRIVDRVAELGAATDRHTCKSGRTVVELIGSADCPICEELRQLWRAGQAAANLDRQISDVILERAIVAAVGRGTHGKEIKSKNRSKVQRAQAKVSSSRTDAILTAMNDELSKSTVERHKDTHT